MLPSRPDTKSSKAAMVQSSPYFNQSKNEEETSPGSGMSSADESERPPSIPPRDPPAPPVPPRDVSPPSNPDPSAYARMQYGGVNFDSAMTPATALLENQSKFEFNEMLGIQQFPQSYYEAIEKINKISINASEKNEGNPSSSWYNQPSNIPPPIPIRDDLFPHGIPKASKVDFWGNTRSKLPKILKQRFPSPPPSSPEQRYRQKQNRFQYPPPRVEQRNRQMAPPPVPARDDMVEGNFETRRRQVREVVNPSRTLSSSPKQSHFSSVFSSSPVQRHSFRKPSSSPHNGQFFNINTARTLSSSPRQGHFFPQNQSRPAPILPQRSNQSEGSDGYIRPLIGPSPNDGDTKSSDELPPPVPPRIPTRKQSRPQR